MFNIKCTSQSVDVVVIVVVVVSADSDAAVVEDLCSADQRESHAQTLKNKQPLNFQLSKKLLYVYKLTFLDLTLRKMTTI